MTYEEKQLADTLQAIEDHKEQWEIVSDPGCSDIPDYLMSRADARTRMQSIARENPHHSFAIRKNTYRRPD